jgi:uncharacterized protein (DUF2249 family)
MTTEIVLDVCGLEPPDPMERVLDALSRLEKDQQVRMRIDREPRPLYRILEQNGYAYTVTPLEGYLYEIVIRQQN